MHKNQLIILFLIGLLTSPQLWALNCSYSASHFYNCEDSASNTSLATTYPWQEISTTGTSLATGDDVVTAVNLPFNFYFGGNNYSTVNISSNGPLEFGGTADASYIPSDIPSATNLPMSIIPYWRDLNPSNGQIRTQTIGTAPNRIFVVQFNAVVNYGSNSTNTFQTQLFENNGTIVFRYKAVYGNGNSGTTGYYYSGSDYGQYSYNTNNLTNGKTVVWTHPAQLLAQYRFEESLWTSASGQVLDSSGNNLHATAIGSPLPTPVTTNPARTGATGTCGYASLPGSATGGGAISIPNLPVKTTTNAKTSVSFWMYWDGINSVMPIGWFQHDLWFSGSAFGFNSAQSDIYGITSTGLANGWHHVVAVFTNGDLTKNQLYIDGSLKTLSQQMGGQSTSLAKVQSSLQISGWTSANNFRLSGRMDEVKVYEGALSASQVSTLYTETHTCPISVGSSPNHIRLEHSGSGLTCSAGTITVKACADATCTSLFGSSTSVTLASTGGTWSSNPVTFTGSTTVNLALTSPGSITLGTSAVSPAAANTTRCFTGATETCVLSFGDSGFVFDIPNHKAETSQTVSITAAQKATGSTACTSAFANTSRTLTVSCSYLNPSSGSLPVRVNGVAVNAGNNSALACDGSGKALNVSFNASGIGTGTILYADVGQMRVDAKYTGSAATGDSGLVMTGSDTFIAAPSGFTFSAVSSAPIKAGSPFNATVSAVNTNNSVTPNFGKELSPEAATLTHQLVQPSGSGANTGNFSGALGSFSNGSSTSNNLTWDEVGLIKLTASLSSANYLGTGYTASGTSSNIGAFVPHHFETYTQQGCPSDGFTYSGQPFQVDVYARNALGATTLNYDGTAGTTPNFAKLLTLSEASTALGSFTPTTIALSSFAAGKATASPSFSYSNSKTIPTDIQVRAADTDASSNGYSEGILNVYSGRLNLQNASGSELLDLAVPLQTEFWSGSYYERHEEDNCTTVPVPTAGSGLVFGSPLAAGQTTASISGVSSGLGIIESGNGQLLLSKPSTGNTGYVDITLNAPSWLEFDWQGTGKTDPSARASFGIYKGDPIQIYFREIY